MIRIERVSKRYPPAAALGPFSLTVAKGETVVVTGPSGCGKTTLLRLIAGLELPDAGEVHLGGQLASTPGWARPPGERGLGFVFQHPSLWPHLTVAENIAYGLHRLAPAVARARVEELLTTAGLAPLAGRHPDALSGGEAKRVALLRTLAPRPAILLLDEPLTNLDGKNRGVMLDLLRATVTDHGLTVVYVTHSRAEAAAVTGRVIALAPEADGG